MSRGRTGSQRVVVVASNDAFRGLFPPNVMPSTSPKSAARGAREGAQQMPYESGGSGPLGSGAQPNAEAEADEDAHAILWRLSSLDSGTDQRHTAGTDGARARAVRGQATWRVHPLGQRPPAERPRPHAKPAALPPLDMEPTGSEYDWYPSGDTAQQQQQQQQGCVVLAPAGGGGQPSQQSVAFPASPALAAPWAEHRGPPVEGHAPRWAEQGAEPTSPSSVIRHVREAPHHRQNALAEGFAVHALNDAAEDAVPARMRSWDVWCPAMDPTDGGAGTHSVLHTTPVSVVPPRGRGARQAHTPPPKGVSPAAPRRAPHSGRRGGGRQASHLTDASVLATGRSAGPAPRERLLSPHDLTAAWAQLADGEGDPQCWPTPSPYAKGGAPSSGRRPPLSSQHSPSPRRKASGVRVSPRAPDAARPLRGSPRVPWAPGRGVQSPRRRAGGALVMGGDFPSSPRARRVSHPTGRPGGARSFRADAGTDWVSPSPGEPASQALLPGAVPHPPPARAASRRRGVGAAPRVRRRMGGIVLPPGGGWAGVAPGRGGRRTTPAFSPKGTQIPSAEQPQRGAAPSQAADIWREGRAESDSEEDEMGGAATTVQRAFRGHLGRQEAEIRRVSRDAERGQGAAATPSEPLSARRAEEVSFRQGQEQADEHVLRQVQAAPQTPESSGGGVERAALSPARPSRPQSPVHAAAPATQEARGTPSLAVAPGVSESGELGTGPEAASSAAGRGGAPGREDGSEGAGLAGDASSDDEEEEEEEEDRERSPAADVLVGPGQAGPGRGRVEPVQAPDEFASDDGDSAGTDSLERVERVMQARNGMPHGLSGSLSVISESEAESRLDRLSEGETLAGRSALRPSRTSEGGEEEGGAAGAAVGPDGGDATANHEARRHRQRQRQTVVWAVIQIQRLMRKAQARQSTKRVAKQLWRPRKDRTTGRRFWYNIWTGEESDTRPVAVAPLEHLRLKAQEAGRDAKATARGGGGGRRGAIQGSSPRAQHRSPAAADEAGKQAMHKASSLFALAAHARKSGSAVSVPAGAGGGSGIASTSPSGGSKSPPREKEEDREGLTRAASSPRRVDDGADRPRDSRHGRRSKRKSEHRNRRHRHRSSRKSSFDGEAEEGVDEKQGQSSRRLLDRERSSRRSHQSDSASNSSRSRKDRSRSKSRSSSPRRRRHRHKRRRDRSGRESRRSGSGERGKDGHRRRRRRRDDRDRDEDREGSAVGSVGSSPGGRSDASTSERRRHRRRRKHRSERDKSKRREGSVKHGAAAEEAEVEVDPAEERRRERRQRHRERMEVVNAKMMGVGSGSGSAEGAESKKPLEADASKRHNRSKEDLGRKERESGRRGDRAGRRRREDKDRRGSQTGGSKSPRKGSRMDANGSAAQ